MCYFFFKANVRGQQCRFCKDGYFHLSEENAQGCLSCWCSGVGTQCSSSAFFKDRVRQKVTSVKSLIPGICSGVTFVDCLCISCQEISILTKSLFNIFKREFMNIMPYGMNQSTKMTPPPLFPNLNEIIVFLWKIYKLYYVNLIISLETLYLHNIYIFIHKISNITICRLIQISREQTHTTLCLPIVALVTPSPMDLSSTRTEMRSCSINSQEFSGNVRVSSSVCHPNSEEIR